MDARGSQTEMFYMHIYNVAQSYIDDLLRPQSVILVLRSLSSERIRSIREAQKEMGGSLGKTLEAVCRSKVDAPAFFQHNKWHDSFLYHILAGGKQTTGKYQLKSELKIEQNIEFWH